LDQGRGRAGLFVKEGTIVPVDETEDAEEESPSSSSWRGGSGGRELSLAFAKDLERSLMVGCMRMFLDCKLGVLQALLDMKYHHVGREANAKSGKLQG
jgi:hypothetical protein